MNSSAHPEHSPNPQPLPNEANWNILTKIEHRPLIIGLILINVLMFVVFVGFESLSVSDDAKVTKQNAKVYEKYCMLWKWDVALQRSPPTGFSYNNFVDFHPLQLLGSMFSHSLANPLHLLVNMYVLFAFGPLVCSAFGKVRFLLFYLFCGLFGGLLAALFDPSKFPVVGASGALCGLIVGFAWFFPMTRMSILFLPFLRLKARAFTAVFFLISVALIVTAFMVPAKNMSADWMIIAVHRISHFGHAAGMAAGFIFILMVRMISGWESVKPYDGIHIIKPQPPPESKPAPPPG